MYFWDERQLGLAPARGADVRDGLRAPEAAVCVVDVASTDRCPRHGTTAPSEGYGPIMLAKPATVVPVVASVERFDDAHVECRSGRVATRGPT